MEVSNNSQPCLVLVCGAKWLPETLDSPCGCGKMEGRTGGRMEPMLIESYPVEDVCARVPEVAAQTDPVLKTLDVLLEEEDQWYQAVRTDLGTRYRQTLVHGRHSTPVEVILRLLLLKHRYSWSYEETVTRVAESLVLRQFARVSFQTVPTRGTLIRWTHTLRPHTLHELNDRVVQLAVQARVTQGRTLRLDSTCVQTEIHHPTDSSVLSRVVQRAKVLLVEQGEKGQQGVGPGYARLDAPPR